jgi:hypothetical protein
MIKKENQVGRKTDETNDKEPYRSPQLVIYGDIHELTQNAANGASDNARDSSDGNKTGRG